MYCIRCGKKIETGHMFCPECLAEMEQYPIKPGTVVQLPPQPKVVPVKKTPSRRRQSLSPEEQIKHLHRKVRLQRFLLVLLSTAILALSALVFYQLEDEDLDFLPGQNYSVDASTDTQSGD